MTDDGPEHRRGGLRPTVIDVNLRKAARPHAAKSAPTVMPGSAPVRLSIDPADLQRLAPNASSEVLAAAISLLGSLIPAHLSDRQALFWAQDLQEMHGRLVEDNLELMRDPLLREIPTHLKRLRDLLVRFDLESILTKSGLLTEAFRRVSGRIDTGAELQSARVEIEQLLHLLTGALDGLVDLKSRLDLRAEQLKPLGGRVEAASLAAAYLAETTGPKLQSAFQERRKSLSTTLIQIRSAEVQHAAQSSLPARLVVAIQNIALVALPAWLERLANFQAKLASSHRPSLTEARELNFRLADLIPLFTQTE